MNYPSLPEKKRLLVVVPGAEVGHVVLIQPGYTVQNIKSMLPQLLGYDLFKAHDNLRLRDDVDLYSTLKNDSKLYAASRQDVGDFF